VKTQLAVIVLIGLSVSASAADGGPRFQFRKAVELNAAATEEVIAVPLDSDVYAGTRDGYPDLRIVDDLGTMVPYLLEPIGKKRINQVREACASKLVSLHVDEGKGLEIVVALDEKAPSAGGLSIQTPLTDYEHRVRVFGLKSGSDWTPLVEGGVIFDYSRFMDIRNRDVALPLNQYRQFKIVVEQELDEKESPLRELMQAREEGKDGKKETRVEITRNRRTPFHIDRVDLWRTLEREGGTEAESFPYTTTGFRVELDAKEKVTRVEVVSRREPLKSLTFATSSRNFSRKARVKVPVEHGVRTDWVEVGRSTVVNIQYRAFRRADLKVEFPEQREEHYRLEIENADNPPLEITGVDAAGAGYRLVFLRSEGRTYRLEYGSEKAPAPSYDTAAVLASLNRGYEPLSVKLGPRVPNPGYRGRGGLEAFLNSPLFLILAIVAMVLVLAWALFRAGTRIKKLPSEEV
jgi:hypothetical protein